MTQQEAMQIKMLADQWANHCALAALAHGHAKRFKCQRRDEMKQRFLDYLNRLLEGEQ